MRTMKAILFAGTALALSSQAVFAAESAPDSAPAAETVDNTDNAPVDIIVTARRTSERLQDVPVAVSVLSPAVLEARGTFNPVDIAMSAPGLNVTASIGDRNNLTYTIRGQGFSFGTVFPAVITYINEIPVTRLTQGMFFDLANVQVLRGPQGVNFGRVTDGGNVMVTSQAPKNDFGGYVTVRLGDYGLRTATGALNIPIVDDKVLLRVAGETARRNGFTTNLFNGQTLDNVAYEAVRGALTLKPTSDIENTLTVSYQNTHDNGTGVIFSGFNPAASGLLPGVGRFSFLFAGAYGIDANGNVGAFKPGMTPLNAGAYAASLTSQLAAQNARGPRTINFANQSYSNRRNLYVSNATTFQVSDSIEIKNIFGYNREKEDQASTFEGANGAAVLTCHSACPGAEGVLFTNAKHISNELRVSGKSLENKLTWAIGGYMDEQSPGGPAQNATINVAILNRSGVNFITTKSRAVYGSAEYSVTDNFKLNGGLRYTHDSIRSEQNAYLSPINGGQGALFNFLTGPFGGSLPTAIANQVVAATFAPIPQGKCETYGAGSVLFPTGASPCKVVSGSFNATTWSAGASYKTDQGQLFYAKISKGYRPGGVNGTAGAGNDPTYRPETDVSIEIGAKADFNFNGVFLRTNLAAYTDRYKAIQKNVVLPGPVPLSQVQNVNNARIKGIEGEFTLVPVSGLTFGGNFAYTDAKFDFQDNSRNTSVVNGVTVPADPCNPTLIATAGFCSANRFNSVPEFQYALTLGYDLPLPEELGTITVGGRLFHQSSVPLTDTSALNPQSIEPARSTVDLNVDWKNVGGQPVDLGFFVTNLNNKLYRIGTNNLLQNSSLGISGDIYAAPRMWGFSLKYRFGSDAQ